VKRVVLATLVVLSACASKTPAPCTPPLLVPRSVPAGLHETHMDALVPSARSRTWTDAARTLQIATGVSADLGDGPDVKKASVRGQSAVYGPTGNPAAPLAVEWTEPACGGTQYAAIAKGFSSTQLIEIANGLRPAR
jgi:hypothetical protein